MMRRQQPARILMPICTNIFPSAVQDIPYEPETLKAEVTPEIRAFCTHLIDEKVEKKLYERSYQLEPRIPESQARSSAPPARGS
jgi:hypothetical protein